MVPSAAGTEGGEEEVVLGGPYSVAVTKTMAEGWLALSGGYLEPPSIQGPCPQFSVGRRVLASYLVEGWEEETCVLCGGAGVGEEEEEEGASTEFYPLPPPGEGERL